MRSAKPFSNQALSKLKLKNFIIGSCLTTLVCAPAYAGDYQEIEKSFAKSELMKDTWVVNYEADDFTDKVELAKIIYIPADIQTEAAFFMRCKPYFTNFSIQYTDWEKNLKEGGELPNASDKYAKHGFVYDTKQELEVTVDGDDKDYDISVGGQTNHITKLFKTDQTLQPGQLGMSLFFSFTFAEMPSFRNAKTSSDARDFFQQLNQAVKTEKPIQFQLENDQGWKRNFQLDTARMLKAVPEEVLGFCLTQRKLK